MIYGLEKQPFTQAWDELCRSEKINEETFLEFLREGQLVASIEFPPGSNKIVDIPKTYWKELDVREFDISANDSGHRKQRHGEPKIYSIYPDFAYKTELNRLKEVSEYIVRHGKTPLPEQAPVLFPILDPEKSIKPDDLESWVILQKKLFDALSEYFESEDFDCEVFIEHENWLVFCEEYGIGEIVSPVKKSGRQERECWNAIWEEATRCLINTGPCENKEELARRLNKWAARKFGPNLAPKINTISKKLSKFK